jgi:ADP-heptose:LPS heptosyltransferase
VTTLQLGIRPASGKRGLAEWDYREPTASPYKQAMRGLFITSTRLGDAILSTGVLAWMLDRGLSVSVACGPVAAPVFEGVPGVERVIPMRKGPMGAHWRGLWGETVGRRWDLVVDLRGSAFAWTVRTGERRVFRAPPDDAHRVDQLGRSLGIDPAPEPCLWISEADRAAAAALIGDDPRPVLALCPTANWPPKAWPADRFVALAEGLMTEMSSGGEPSGGEMAGARILVAGGPNERDLAQPVLDAFEPERRIDLVGTAPLMTLAACFERTRLVVANDSGLMHLAAATGAPTLGLFGPSKQAHYAPRGPITTWVRTDESFEMLEMRRSEMRGPEMRGSEMRDGPGSLMTGLPVQRALDAARRLLSR